MPAFGRRLFGSKGRESVWHAKCNLPSWSWMKEMHLPPPGAGAFLLGERNPVAILPRLTGSFVGSFAFTD
jgi:hypothetical protein